MDRRRLLAGGALALVAGPALARKGPRPPATAKFLARDLTGTWTNATYTDLERPKTLLRPVLTPTEAEAYEAPRRALNGQLSGPDDTVGQAYSEFNDRGRGLLRIDGQIRASLIVDPPDGKIPWTAATRARFELDKKPEERRDFAKDNPEERNIVERCLLTAASTAPFIPGPDTNIYQFVQTDGPNGAFLAIESEKYHDTRIVRLDAAPDPRAPLSWLGQSVGRWAGDVLEVTTTGFGPGVVRRAAAVSPATRVVETFQRRSATEILYRATVEDPTLYSRLWRIENLFVPAPGRIYEYACHEGNYGLPDILRIERQAEQAAKGR